MKVFHLIVEENFQMFVNLSDIKNFRFNIRILQFMVRPLSLFAAVVEGLHEAAYKNALCNSLYCPDHMVDNIHSEHVSTFPLFILLRLMVLISFPSLFLMLAFSSSCTSLSRTISQAQEWLLWDSVRDLIMAVEIKVTY